MNSREPCLLWHGKVRGMRKRTGQGSALLYTGSLGVGIDLTAITTRKKYDKQLHWELYKLAVELEEHFFITNGFKHLSKTYSHNLSVRRYSGS